MTMSPSAPRKKGITIPKRTMLFTLLFSGLLLSGLCILSTAQAVMPPAHYEKQAEHSAIKAIAVVKDIRILSETRQHTRKEVVFTLKKPFGANIPEEFTGTCYSVDHKWQAPGVGGTIYHYPVKGTTVLVTITRNHGFITSFTPLDPGLEKEMRANGLTNIAFVMGRARLTSGRKQEEKRAQWFLFYLKDKASGFLHISSHADRQVPMIRQFNHELLTGELDKDRQLFKINTQSRDDGLFTPEWITIQKTEYSPDKTIVGPEREIGFRSVDRTDIKDGILVKGTRNAYDVRIPPDTATDLVLLTAIETFPYEKNFSLRLNLIETLELDLKKDIRIRYQGQDPDKNNLHVFSQTGRSTAAYWLNDRHELMEWRWDKDKRFVRGTENEAMTILQ